MRLIHCLRLTEQVALDENPPLSHSAIDQSQHQHAAANTRSFKRIVEHRNCTPKRAASREIFYDRNPLPAWIRQIVNPSVEGGVFQLDNEFNAVWAFARDGPVQGVGSIFLDEEGEAPPVGSGANALIAFKCCIENNRRAVLD